jgi:predicted HAD superfamily phosphohydrolase YqeG
MQVAFTMSRTTRTMPRLVSFLRRRRIRMSPQLFSASAPTDAGPASRGLRVLYRSCREASAVPRILAELEPRTAIVDIEPLIAAWNSAEGDLDAGITAFLAAVADHPGRLRDVVFATNSARRPSVIPAAPGLRIGYVSHAGKPLRARPYRRLAGPCVVVGDQIATDGILAWRLGLTFVHYIPDDRVAPVGPRLLRALGRPLRRALFRPS